MHVVGLQKWMLQWLAGMMVVLGMTGCSGTVIEAQASYKTAVAQATASRNGIQAQGYATPMPNSLSAEATHIKLQFEFAGKQAENQSFTTILVGLIILFTISGLTVVGVRLYARKLKYKTALAEQFIYSAQQQANRRF
jgi:hypothetical protein